MLPTNVPLLGKQPVTPSAPRLVTHHSRTQSEHVHCPSAVNTSRLYAGQTITPQPDTKASCTRGMHKQKPGTKHRCARSDVTKRTRTHYAPRLVTNNGRPYTKWACAFLLSCEHITCSRTRSKQAPQPDTKPNCTRSTHKCALPLSCEHLTTVRGAHSPQPDTEPDCTQSTHKCALPLSCEHVTTVRGAHSPQPDTEPN